MQDKIVTSWCTHQDYEESQVWWVKEKHQDEKPWEHELGEVLEYVIYGFSNKSMFKNIVFDRGEVIRLDIVKIVE